MVPISDPKRIGGIGAGVKERLRGMGAVGNKLACKVVRNANRGGKGHGQIREVCERIGTEWLKPSKEALPEEVSHEETRFVVAEIKREKKVARGE
jgi:hypothetical protein